MKPKEIIALLKEQYNRNLRKQMVRSMLEDEKEAESNDKTYQFINQIFSYVLQSLNWNIANNSQKWDNTPLEIMKDTFPKIETTKWYQEQKLVSSRSIDVVSNIS